MRYEFLEIARSIFKEKLEELGFVVIEEQRDGPCGSFYLDMAKGNIKFRFVNDRSIPFICVDKINDQDWLYIRSIIDYKEKEEIISLIGTGILEQLSYTIQNIEWFLNEFYNCKEKIQNDNARKWKEE